MSTLLATDRPWGHRVLLGGMALGTLDLAFVSTFWALARDVAPQRILQSIAAGVQGAAAFDGGHRSALLGALCHYFIATMMVLAYAMAAIRLPVLIAQPVRHGLPYGLLLYGVMTYVVVPLSHAPQPTKIYLPWMVASIIMHAAFGVVCAWFARWAQLGRMK